MKKKLLWTLFCRAFSERLSFSLCQCLEVELLRHRVRCMLFFKEPTRPFSKKQFIFYTPTNKVCESASCFISLQTFGVVTLFNFIVWCVASRGFDTCFWWLRLLNTFSYSACIFKYLPLWHVQIFTYLTKCVVSFCYWVIEVLYIFVFFSFILLM